MTLREALYRLFAQPVDLLGDSACGPRCAMLAECFYRATTQTPGERTGEAPHPGRDGYALDPLESPVHWLRHTVHLKVSIVSSMIFKAISTLDYCAMQRGTMVVGRNSVAGAGHARPAAGNRRLPAVGPLWLFGARCCEASALRFTLNEKLEFSFETGL